MGGKYVSLTLWRTPIALWRTPINSKSGSQDPKITQLWIPVQKFDHVVRLIDLGGYGQLFRHRFQKKILARLAAILTILSVSRECIDILNMFYKNVFRSTPPRHGDTSILRSRELVKSQIRSVYSKGNVTVQMQYSKN